MRTNAFFPLALLLVAGGALAGCGEEPVPDIVSFARDIKPLMEARCVRCHGGGGMLNDDPYSQPTSMETKPEAGDFRHIETVNGISGLGTYAGPGVGLLRIYIDPKDGPPLMPPLPAPPLTAREKEMLLKWAAGNPPNP
jgi:hypothetical protein